MAGLSCGNHCARKQRVKWQQRHTPLCSPRPDAVSTVAYEGYHSIPGWPHRLRTWPPPRRPHPYTGEPAPVPRPGAPTVESAVRHRSEAVEHGGAGRLAGCWPSMPRRLHNQACRCSGT